jgi:large subunit ribosomal protein L24
MERTKLGIKKGDEVRVIAGASKGGQGKIVRVLRAAGRVVVEGVNVRPKHVRARRQREKGQIVEAPRSVHLSNVQLICPHCKAGTRVARRKEGDRVVRVCKKCSGALN